MGLLTDPRAGTGKIIKLLLKWEKPLCFVLYVTGVVWLTLLALPMFNDNTYFSENALLPGLVTKESNLEQISKQYYYELVHEMKRYPDSMPYAWLSAKFSQLYLDVHVHNFSLIYPFQEQKFTGQNIYGIVRAPRASSTEAIVVSAPYRPINSIHLDTAPSIALLLAFAKFCRKQKYWAKDIIFLVTEHEQLGMQAWLDAYHGVTSGQEGILLAGDLSGRAGSIQAAINLEFHAMKITSIDVKIEGLNGQLPNLDLFNLAQNMIAKEGIRQSFQRRFDVNYRNKFKSWWYYFNTLMSMIVTQATGVPTGNHGFFHRFGIEAITLEGFEKSGKDTGANFYQIGRVVESIVRSLNNLLERFHQSYFFYLLPSTDRYISIGLYMRPLVLIIASVFIKAFSIWQRLQASSSSSDTKDKENETNEQKDKENETNEQKDKENETNEQKDKQNETNEQKDNIEQNLSNKIEEFDIGSIASEILWAHMFGVLVMASPRFFTLIGSQIFKLRTEDTLYGSFAVLTILMILWRFNLRRSIRYENISLICVIASIELGTALMCIAMHNFSLALLTAVVYVPVILFITPHHESASRFRSFQYIAWVLLHPFIVSAIVVHVYTCVNFSTDPILSVLVRGHRAYKQALVFSIIDSMIYGNWLYNVITAVMIPIWLLFWNVMRSNVVMPTQ